MTVIYAVLAILLFLLGTGGPAIFVDSIQKYVASMMKTNPTYANANAWLSDTAVSMQLPQRCRVWSAVMYAFGSCVVLSGGVVIVATARVRKECRVMGITDKVLDFIFGCPERLSSIC